MSETPNPSPDPAETLPPTVPTASSEDVADAVPEDPAEHLAPGLGLPPEVIETRHGLFGTPDTGDTSGFGGLVAPVELPPASPRPYGGWFDDAVDHLVAHLTDPEAAIVKVVVAFGELTLDVHRDHLAEVLQTLRDVPDLRFELSLGVSGVHYPADAGCELHAVYHLVSITHGGRTVRVEASAPQSDPHLPSTVSIYPAHDWHEREVYDMFGLIFDEHPALARILMPNDWVGHPQRKDYPLGGVNVQFHGASVPPPDERRRSYS
jgi:NADH-quinone oxidoreductase subunit C